MAEEVWQEIQNAEVKAAQIMEQARQNSLEMVKKAREDAAKILKDTETKAVAQGEAALAQASRQIESWQQEQFNRVDQAVQTLKALGEKKLGDAVNLIIEKVVSLK